MTMTDRQIEREKARNAMELARHINQEAWWSDLITRCGAKQDWTVKIHTCEITIGGEDHDETRWIEIFAGDEKLGQVRMVHHNKGWYSKGDARFRVESKRIPSRSRWRDGHRDYAKAGSAFKCMQEYFVPNTAAENCEQAWDRDSEHIEFKRQIRRAHSEADEKVRQLKNMLKAEAVWYSSTGSHTDVFAKHLRELAEHEQERKTLEHNLRIYRDLFEQQFNSK